MYKRLRIYYLYTALPFILLLVAAFAYRDAIAKTITTNPHPQINYLIFVITLVGGILILKSMNKLMFETKELSKFTEAQRQGASTKELHEMALECDADIAYVLRMISATSNRAISHQEQIALENELHKATFRLSSRNALPQFLSGLLVGLGLLGTFIGLLATLDDIAVLITSFGTMDMNTANPIEVFGEMVKKMEAPMHSMGIAFSASMYGLLGSLVLSFMMVSLRRCMTEILAILGSEIAQHIEFALAHAGFAYSKTGLNLDLSKRPADPLVLGDVLPQQSGQKQGDKTAPESSQKPEDKTTPAQGDDSDAVKAPVISNPVNMGTVITRGLEDGDTHTEEVRILNRIAERMAESAKLQERTLNSEVKDFQNQRGDMLRTLAEGTEASNNFRSELQRVGRQLGVMLSSMEQNKISVEEQMLDMKLRMSEDGAEMQRLLGILIEIQRK